MIDVIIPCYNSHEFITRALSSIAMQTIKNEVQVTLVSDGGGHYKYYTDLFSNLLHIQEIGYEENRGPGYARRFGFQNTNGEYIVNLDADDTFLSAFALQILKKSIFRHDICVTPFLQEHKDDFVEITNKNMVWLHGIMYKREFLEKNNILMNESYSNEDVGFNLLCKLLTDNINYVDRLTYCWHYNKNSIVRKDIPNYRDNLSFDGYVENVIWAFREAENRNVDEQKLRLEKLRIMLNLHILFKQSIGSSPKFEYKNLNLCKKYYNEVFKQIENIITKDEFITVYNSYTKDDVNTYLSMKSINEFMERLQEG